MTETSKILLVDDNPTNIDVLYNFLADEGYEVLIAEDGTSALERVPLVNPDIILLDVMMPHVDGFEVCSRLQENPETKEIPVIFITALGSVDDKLTGFQSGGVDYVTKPFQNDEILARIRNHLDLRKMRKNLEVQNEQLRTQNESLDAYARTVAHDLKNPLNLILNFAKFIEQEDVLTGTSKEDLGRIIDSAEQMNHIIQDLLLLAQLRKEDVNSVRVNMEAVVHMSLDRLHLELTKNEVDLEMPSDWPEVIGIASWVQAVWVNYISNAIKYGGESRKVKLSWTDSPDRPGFIRFHVEDNGPGIADEQHDTIFDEFTRVGGERSEGHGIGLSIVRRIIRRLGGDVSVKNVEPGPGSCFSFDLEKA